MMMKRFSHILVIRHAVAILLGLLAFSHSAAAAEETLRKAVVQNFITAMTVCIDTYEDARQIGHRLNKTGYLYQPEDFGGGDIAHWFLAPGQPTPLTVLLDASPQSRFCAISTDHINVIDALFFARGILGRKFTGQKIVHGDAHGVYTVDPGHPKAQNEPCTGFHLSLIHI